MSDADIFSFVQARRDEVCKRAHAAQCVVPLAESLSSSQEVGRYAYGSVSCVLFMRTYSRWQQQAAVIFRDALLNLLYLVLLYTLRNWRRDVVPLTLP